MRIICTFVWTWTLFSSASQVVSDTTTTTTTNLMDSSHHHHHHPASTLLLRRKLQQLNGGLCGSPEAKPCAANEMCVDIYEANDSTCEVDPHGGNCQGACSRHSHCVADGGGAAATRDKPQDHCECDDGYVPLYGDDQSRCDVKEALDCSQGGDNQKYNPDSGECECKMGYINLNAGKNNQPLNCIEGCPSDGCGGEHSHCKDGYCQCQEGYIPKYENNISGDCKPVSDEEICADVKCGLHSHCNVNNGACQCENGFVPVIPGDKSECQAPCSNAASCGAHSECQSNGVCTCKAGYVLSTDDGSKKCVLEDENKTSIPVETCSPECREHSTCILGSCECDSGYRKSLFGNTCRKQVLNGPIIDSLLNRNSGNRVGTIRNGAGRK